MTCNYLNFTLNSSNFLNFFKQVRISSKIDWLQYQNVNESCELKFWTKFITKAEKKVMEIFVVKPQPYSTKSMQHRLSLDTGGFLLKVQRVLDKKSSWELRMVSSAQTIPFSFLQGAPQKSLGFSFCNFSAPNAIKISIFDIFTSPFWRLLKIAKILKIKQYLTKLWWKY